MENNIRVLIVEDDQDIAENISEYLEVRGFILDFAIDGIMGLHLALTNAYDVIILDLMLPGMDGISLCRKLRQEGERQVPVLMLTARDTLGDKLEGFDSGTDDYMVKPFALSELAARVSALSKRRLPIERSLKVGGLTMDLGSRQVTRQGQTLKLNKACTTLLKLLMENSPGLVTKKEMENALWGDTPPGSDVLRSHIYQLRKRVDKPFERPLIQTVHGVGLLLKAQINKESQ